MFNSNGQDDEDMLRQMRNLYICSNKLLRTFHYCSTDVKLELSKVTVLYFIVVIYGLHTKNQHSTGYVVSLARGTRDS